MKELLSAREIARRTGLSRTTVAKYMKQHVVEEYDPGFLTTGFSGKLGRFARRRGRRIVFTRGVLRAIMEIRHGRD